MQRTQARTVTPERKSRFITRAGKYFTKPKPEKLDKDPEEIFNFLQDEFSTSRTHYIENMLTKFKQKTNRISGTQEKQTGTSCFVSRTGVRKEEF
jgi:hypothetical protein